MPDQPDYLRPYAEAVRTHGPTFEATLWLNRQKQTDRFRVIAEAIDLTGRIIVDAGCGLGDLASYLCEHNIQYGRYIGLEAMPEMVEQARSRNLPEARFEIADFALDEQCFPRLASSDRYDIAVFSGSLNTFKEDHARAVIKRAFDAANEDKGGVVFNFLSARHGKKHTPDPSPARRFDPVKMTDWALKLTPRVLLRQDYMGGHDATIAMFKA
ncbi:MAG: class I SAM-dependent methyltransferase [Phycisphaerales bacterium]|nr:class I SAM-dependent methyltransferase [Phycisphaerales bacterium]